LIILCSNWHATSLARRKTPVGASFAVFIDIGNIAHLEVTATRTPSSTHSSACWFRLISLDSHTNICEWRDWVREPGWFVRCPLPVRDSILLSPRLGGYINFGRQIVVQGCYGYHGVKPLVIPVIQSEVHQLPHEFTHIGVLKTNPSSPSVVLLSFFTVHVAHTKPLRHSCVPRDGPL